MNRVPYFNVVGWLMFVMVCNRPYITYAMSKVSRFMSNPRKTY